MRRPAERHCERRGASGDPAGSQAPWPGGRAGRSRASEPGTAPVGSADLTPLPMPAPPGPRAGTGAADRRLCRLAFPGDKGKIHGPDDVARVRLRLDRGAQPAISTPIATRRYRFDRIRCSTKVAYTSYSPLTDAAAYPIVFIFFASSRSGVEARFINAPDTRLAPPHRRTKTLAQFLGTAQGLLMNCTSTLPAATAILQRILRQVLRSGHPQIGFAGCSGRGPGNRDFYNSCRPSCMTGLENEPAATTPAESTEVS